jgi:hypothetical protein
MASEVRYIGLSAGEWREQRQLVSWRERITRKGLGQIEGAEWPTGELLTAGESSQPSDCIAHGGRPLEGELDLVEAQGFGVAREQQNADPKRGNITDRHSGKGTAVAARAETAAGQKLKVAPRERATFS